MVAEALIQSPVFEDKGQFSDWLKQHDIVILHALRGSQRILTALDGYPPYSSDIKNQIEVIRWLPGKCPIKTTILVDNYCSPSHSWDVRVGRQKDGNGDYIWDPVHKGSFDRMLIDPVRGLILVEENDAMRREYNIEPSGVVTMTAIPKIVPTF